MITQRFPNAISVSVAIDCAFFEPSSRIISIEPGDALMSQI